MIALLASAPLVLLAVPSSALPAPATPAAGVQEPPSTPAPEPIDGAPGLGDPYYPTMGNGGYDVLHTRLELAVDMETDVLEGRALHDVRATAALRSFHLDLASFLEASAVRVDGEPAAFEQAEGELVVRPARPIPSGAEVRVEVAYSGRGRGRPDPAVQFGGPEPMRLGWVPYEEGVFTLSQPSGAPTFFPCNDHPSDKATYEFEVSVARPWTVAANGLLEGVDELEGGARRFRFRARDPMATYLVTVNVGELRRVVREGPDGLPLNYYVPVERDVEETLRPAARTPEMIERFSELFGPYPFESFGAVVAPLALPGALETQTLPVYGVQGFREEVIAHELAHQWFGNHVSLERWSDIWLSEGFAVYAEALWTESAYGPGAFEEKLRASYRLLDRYDFPGPGDPGVENLFGGSVYLRGGWVLHALRLAVGDEDFFRGLRLFQQRFGGGNASTDDLRAVLEEVSGEDLGPLLDAWLHAAELPAVPEMGLAPAAEADPGEGGADGGR